MTRALIVTPHSSGHVPADVLAEMLGEDLFDPERRAAHLRHLFDEGDPYTDLLFSVPGVPSLHAQASRFVVDLNRDRDAGGDNGVVKLTDFDGRPLYPARFQLSEAQREERLARHWDPVHREIERVLAGQDTQLLVNGHSMQPRGPLIGPDAGRARPALTLMTAADASGGPLPGRTHSSVTAAQADGLIGALERHFGPSLADTDLSRIALNDPWQLDELSYRYSDPARARPVPGFGLEFNRALYLQQEDGAEVPDHAAIRALNAAFRLFLADAVQIVGAPG